MAFVAVEGSGAKDISVVDSKGEVVVTVFLDGFSKCHAEHVGGFHGDVNDV